MSSAISLRRMRAVNRPGANSLKADLAARHLSCAQSQRSAKAQRPAQDRARGTWPRNGDQ